jgi:predicted DNA-binding helix-hairpin-helix protein
MDLDTKLELLADAAQYDLCTTYSQGGRRYRRAATLPRRDEPITWASADEAAGSKPQPVFRVLMSSRCDWNCAYCPLRSGNDGPRAELEPEELVKAFLPRYEAGTAQGLFLSSAVSGGVGGAVGRMLDGVELLRKQHNYTGYVHVKLLPGVAHSDVERAARLADRVSLNLEAPGPEYLARISPERNWENDLLVRLRWANEWQRAGSLPSGLATQFVVGAAGEHDRDLLLSGAWLYRDLGLRRVYFSPFRPLSGTPLEGSDATPRKRVQRLQEADWLVREYGFETAELPFREAGDLPLHLDPKLAWALANPQFFPLDLNTATREQLLRVPGLGPTGVARILRLRRIGRFRELVQLEAIGAPARRARDFVTFDGRFFGRPHAELLRSYDRPQPIVEQLRLW